MIGDDFLKGFVTGSIVSFILYVIGLYLFSNC